MKRKKIETAGRLVRAVIYTAALPRDDCKQRQAKTQISSCAQEQINLRKSWQKLEVLMAANFGGGDLVVTLTYRDSALPVRKDDAVKRLKRFFRLLRKHRAARGEELHYIYNTEGWHGDHRWHHHVIINSTGADYDVIRSLWSDGDDIDFQRIDLKGYEGWAKYLTKEPREYGNPRVGERNFVPSMGLRKPIVDADYCADNMTLTAPTGSVVLDRSETHNEYGEFIYLKYLLPDHPLPAPPNRLWRACETS